MSSSAIPISKFCQLVKKKKTSLSHFYDLLSDMKHQRIAVITIAVGQTAISHFSLFLICLGLIHTRQISKLLLADRQMDQKLREEYYKTPKMHEISPNNLRYIEADLLVSYTLVLLCIATTFAAAYVLCTLGLLIGVMKRRSELMLPWLILQSIICSFFAVSLLGIYLCPNQLIDHFVDPIYIFRCLIVVIILFANIICLLIVHKYHQGLKMLKRLNPFVKRPNEEAVLSTPNRAIPFHSQEENMYVDSDGFKHLLANPSPNYVV